MIDMYYIKGLIITLFIILFFGFIAPHNAFADYSNLPTSDGVQVGDVIYIDGVPYVVTEEYTYDTGGKGVGGDAVHTVYGTNSDGTIDVNDLNEFDGGTGFGYILSPIDMSDYYYCEANPSACVGGGASETPVLSGRAFLDYNKNNKYDGTDVSLPYSGQVQMGSTSNGGISTAIIGGVGVYGFYESLPPEDIFTYMVGGQIATSNPYGYRFLGWDAVAPDPNSPPGPFGTTFIHTFYPNNPSTIANIKHPGVPVGLTGTSSQVDLIFEAPNSISGRVWYDKNGNGLFDDAGWCQPTSSNNSCSACYLPSAPLTQPAGCNIVYSQYAPTGTYLQVVPSERMATGSWTAADTTFLQSAGFSPTNVNGNFTVNSTNTSLNANTSSGNFFFQKYPGTYTLVIKLPTGYMLKSVSGNTNPRTVTLPTAAANGNAENVNFELMLDPLPPVCVGGLSVAPVSPVNPGESTTLSVTTCTNVEDPDDGVPPPPFNWDPDTGGNNPPPTISGQTDTPTGSTTTWTAPSCPASQTIYSPQVVVAGGGITTSYNTSITVPATVEVAANVRSVSSVGACTSSSGVAYNDGATGATLNLTGGGGAINQNQTTNEVSGQTLFSCLPQGNYQLSLQVPAGYSVVGTDVTPAVESSIGSNGLSFTTGANSQTATFCIAPFDPWFQTNQGDVRFLNLSNPVPSGLYGSTDATYPGIFYSSNSNADFGAGGASARNWAINNEYSYNADTESRNGGMSYYFYKSKTKQDGVTITPISSGTFDQTQVVGSGVYEAPSDLTINLYQHVNGRRVVILVNGNVTVNYGGIAIPQNQGIFIVAAKGNITIAKTIGTSTLSSTASNLDGYYSAQGSIIVDGDTCTDGTTSDLRLNIGGAFIANSLKPFSTTGTGVIQNNRSLCTNNLLYPSLYISSRPDFITQLTDFYKTSYTKWQEVNP